MQLTTTLSDSNCKHTCRGTLKLRTSRRSNVCGSGSLLALQRGCILPHEHPQFNRSEAACAAAGAKRQGQHVLRGGHRQEQAGAGAQNRSANTL